jgi:hypothetical protein
VFIVTNISPAVEYKGVTPKPMVQSSGGVSGEIERAPQDKNYPRRLLVRRTSFRFIEFPSERNISARSSRLALV